MPAAPRDEDAVTALALAAGRGDDDAAERFIRATQRDVWRLTAHLVGPGHADDLTQETYLRALGSLARFEARSPARAWLLSIARRVVVDHFRARSSRPQVDRTADWEAAADRQWLRERPDGGRFSDGVDLHLVLDQLDAERREVLVLTQLVGLSYAEVAEICDCPVGTVRSRVARARADLIALITEDAAADAG